jgi:hypothetical protein
MPSNVKQILRKIPLALEIRRHTREACARRQFRKEFAAFGALAGRSPDGPRFRMEWNERWPCLTDRTAKHDFDKVYVYHTAWAARILARIRPAVHVDCSSLLYFATLVSAFVPVKFYDYRPFDIRLPNLQSLQGDLTRLPMADASVESLSCLHVLEHIGLGRYGDPLDPDGDLKAIAELKRVLAPGGSLLFVTPTGRPRIQYNAHRIYSYRQIVDYFAPLKLKQFALLPDEPAAAAGLIENASEDLADAQAYGCGCYWLVRE